MKEILEAKLIELDVALKTASNWEYYLGQYTLCKELLSQCVHIEFNYDTQEYYDSHFDDDDEFYSDPLEDYYSDLAMYKHEEISDMYNKHYHYSWWIGKNVINTDSYWFTSDEIEAFRIIWQRRISAV